MITTASDLHRVPSVAVREQKTAGQPQVSVVVSTHDRAAQLGRTLQHIAAQEITPGCFELIVVDNNCSDDTPAVVENIRANFFEGTRYILERKQGSAFARNAGAAAARAPILAFLDDDLIVAPDWLEKILSAFDKHADIACVVGKILPVWEHEPPVWLSEAHWGPLALMDFGDAPLLIDRSRPICLMAGVMACRKSVFDELGGFSPIAGREAGNPAAGPGTCEDRDFSNRIVAAGFRSLYLPTITVLSEISSERMTKDYHRRWYRTQGASIARLREEEMERSRAHFLGVPGHQYRQALENAAGWLMARLRRDSSSAFKHEARLHFFRGFFRQRLADRRSGAQ